MGQAPSTPVYTLQNSWSGASFFNGFNFYADADPTHGFVTYVNQSAAQQMELISARDGQPTYIGVDYKNWYDSSKPFYNINGVGRPSVRIESQKVFTKGLFTIDVAHMPGDVCGVWPAFWTFGDNWPYQGEIDIIEGVGMSDVNQAALHTGGTCDAPGAGSSQTGNTYTTNCKFPPNNGVGCAVTSAEARSFGSDFNSIGGGVYAMEWTDARIRMWFFPRGSVPSDMTATNPNPNNWGTPFADFIGNCDINSQFANHKIVLDTTFCGDWAGSVWGDRCASLTGAPSCQAYVGNNPSAFKEQYWSINYIKAFQLAAPASTTTTTTTTTTRSTTTTTTTTTMTTTTTTTSTTTVKPTTTTTLTTTTSTTTAKPTTTTTTTTTTKTTTTTSATPTSTLSPFTYIGCYSDSDDRVLQSNDAFWSGTLKIVDCKNFCVSRANYKYFGVENGNQCFCGNTIRSTSTSGVRKSDSECSTACTGDSTAKCGAGGRMNIYGQ